MFSSPQSADQLIRVVQEANTLETQDSKKLKIDILSNRMVDVKRVTHWQDKWGSSFAKQQLPKLLTPWKCKDKESKKSKDKSQCVMDWIERETTDQLHNTNLEPISNVKYYTHELRD